MNKKMGDKTEVRISSLRIFFSGLRIDGIIERAMLHIFVSVRLC